jgi:hypothetical protein
MILLGDFSAKVSRKDIFKLTIGNENLHKISNDDDRIRVVNFATFKILTVQKRRPHNTTPINIFEHFQMVKPTMGLTIF